LRASLSLTRENSEEETAFFYILLLFYILYYFTIILTIIVTYLLGETDWKILAINVDDENANKYNDIGDVPQETKDKVFTFLRDYKIPSGSGPNQFAFNSELQPKVLEEIIYCEDPMKFFIIIVFFSSPFLVYFNDIIVSSQSL
jgi:hypothetical protein